MDAIEVPQYFVCPISLQIMKDPVTALTGITYDRESIERWLFADNHPRTCPVTNQPLSRDSDLTPNHTLRRLIQAWCTVNSSKGVDRIPTPRAPANKAGVLNLLQDLSVPQLQFNSLKVMASLATDSESNRRCMEQAGVARHMIALITTSFRKNQIDRVAEALRVLHVLRVPLDGLKPFVDDNYEIIESLTWVLRHSGAPAGSNHETRAHAVLLLESIFKVVQLNQKERLIKPEFFEAVVLILHDRISQQATKAALKVLLEACTWKKSRTKIVEAGAVAEIIELELTTPEKRITELAMGVLDHLCECADGRAELVQAHAAGLAVVSNTILRVSSAADDRAVRILLSLCKFSATWEVLQEMLNVGAVSKLCLVLQAGCPTFLKEKARLVLRLHSEVWKNSPCMAENFLTRYRYP